MLSFGTWVAEVVQVAREGDAIRIEKVWTTQATAGAVVYDGGVPMQRVHQQIVRHVRWIES